MHIFLVLVSQIRLTVHVHTASYTVKYHDKYLWAMKKEKQGTKLVIFGVILIFYILDMYL